MQRGSLQTITYVLRFDEKQTQFLMDSNLMLGLVHLLKSDNNLIRLGVCEALIVLAGVRKRIQVILRVSPCGLYLLLKF